MLKRKNHLVPILALALASPIVAQEPSTPPEALIDRVIAVVGDSVVLSSQVEEQLLRLAASGQQLPQDSDALNQLRRQMLGPLVNQLLLVQAAERDSVVVASDAVQAQVDVELQRRRRAVGGAAAFQTALRESGLSEAQFRRILTEDLRQTMLIQQYLQKVQQERRPPPVTVNEMREFFQERQADMGQRPATIAFRQVVVAPEPTDSARAAARARADSLLALIQDGADFAELARRNSDDPGSAERGGELGWFRPGQMVPEFERAAYSLRPGQLSGVVETSFGYHIIKLEKVKGPERQARHILITPTIPPFAEDTARARAGEVARLAREGVSMDSLRTRFGAQEEEYRIGPALRDQLPDPYGTELADAAEGDVVGPFPVEGRGQTRFAVVKVTEIREAGEYSLEDDQVRTQIRQQLERQKLLDELITELRQRTYVDIRF